MATACSNDSKTDDAGSIDLGMATQDDAGEKDVGASIDAGDMDMGTGGDAGAQDAGGIDPNSEPFRTLRESGPSNLRYDIVVIGDGYTQEELATTYASHVNHLTGRMFTRRSKGATEPFRAYRSMYNVHRIHLASNESGIDDPGNSIEKDTALDGLNTCATIGNTHCFVDLAKAKAAVDKALMGSDIQPDVIVVVLNSTEALAHAEQNSMGRFAIYSGGPVDQNPVVDVSERALRELARAMTGADYTSGGGGAYMGAEPEAPNLTSAMDGSKWSHWMGFNPSGDDIEAIGVFPGGGGFDSNIYRPSRNSKLRDAVPGPYDAVTREAIILATFDGLQLIQSHTDNMQRLENPPFIDVRAVNFELTDIKWSVNGQPTEQTGDRFGFTGWAQVNGIGNGMHTVTASVALKTRFPFPEGRGGSGTPTDFVRKPDALVPKTVQWRVLLRP